jgi:hypothetical protein
MHVSWRLFDYVVISSPHECVSIQWWGRISSSCYTVAESCWVCEIMRNSYTVLSRLRRLSIVTTLVWENPIDHPGIKHIYLELIFSKGMLLLVSGILMYRCIFFWNGPLHIFSQRGCSLVCFKNFAWVFTSILSSVQTVGRFRERCSQGSS